MAIVDASKSAAFKEVERAYAYLNKNQWQLVKACTKAAQLKEFMKSYNTCRDAYFAAVKGAFEANDAEVARLRGELKKGLDDIEKKKTTQKNIEQTLASLTEITQKVVSLAGLALI